MYVQYIYLKPYNFNYSDTVTIIISRQ